MPINTSNHYSSALFLLELDGTIMGFLRSVEGGEAYAEVVNESPAADGVVKKHIGPAKYQAIVMTFGAGMAKVLYQWMTDVMAHTSSTKNGAIRFVDYNYKERARLEFDQAAITGVGFPAVDGASKDPALFTLTLQPGVTRYNSASLGTNVTGFSTKSPKVWKASNFRLKISGLEAACAKTNAVEAITVTQASNEKEREPTTVLDIPSVRFTVSESTAKDLLNWGDDFVVNGKNDSGSERSGSLEFLDAAQQTTLFTLRFSGLGVVRIRRVREEAGASVIARIDVELYCEAMTFVPAAEAIGSSVASTATTTSQGDTSSTAGTLRITDTLLNIVAGRLTPEDALKATLTTSNATILTGGASAATDTSEFIARRLLTTVAPVAVGPIVPKWDDGVTLGQQWATDTATIDELSAIKTINQEEWSGLNLGSGHSLVATLRGQGKVPAGADGPLQLERDAFVEGIVAGAIQVLNNAAPHLTRLSTSQ